MWIFKVPICTSYILISPLENTGIFFGNISAINAAQIKVTFNKTVTDEDLKDEIEKESNYTLEDSDDDEITVSSEDVISNAELDEEDGKSVILTVNPKAIKEDDDYYRNQRNYKLTLDEKITGEEVEKTFKVDDYDIPEVTSAEVVGIDTIKVKFTEPIRPKKDSDGNEKELKDTFEVNDDNISIDKVVPIDNGKEANIVLASDLKDGEEVNLEVKSEAEDFAGYALKHNNFKMKAEKNKEELAIVGYKKAKEGEITLILNKDVKFADSDELKEDDKDILEDFYHTNSKTNPSEVSIDGNEVKLTFKDKDDYLPKGTAYVHIKAGVLEDLWEKENNDLMIKSEIAADDTKPEVKKVEQGDNNKEVKVIFSEEVDDEEANKSSNYTLTDKEGKKISVIGANLNSDDDEVTLKLSKELDGGKKYYLETEDVEDKAGNEISKKKVEFTAEQKDAVDFDDISASIYQKGDSNQKLVVDFDSKMKVGDDKYSITNLDNYTLQFIKGTDAKGNPVVKKSINLSDYHNAKANAISDNTKVELTIPGNKSDKEDEINLNTKTAENLVGNTEAADDIKLVIGRVADAEDNLIDEIAYPAIKLNLDDNTYVGLDDDNPEATDIETIKMVLEDEVTAEKADFHIMTTDEAGADKELTVSKFDPDKKDGKTEITFTLDKKNQLDFNGKYDGHDVYIQTGDVQDKIKTDNKYDEKIQANRKYLVNDKISPELALLDEDKNDEVFTNGRRNSAARVELDDREDYDNAVVVTAFTPSVLENDDVKTHGEATVTLTFEENVTGLTNNTFELDDDDIKIKKVNATDNNNVVTIDLQLDDETNADELKGLSIKANNVIVDNAKEYKHIDKIDGSQVEEEQSYFHGNEAIDLECQVEDVSLSQAIPTETLNGVAPTAADTKDGKITGVTTKMEYRLENADKWTAVTGTEITGLAVGTYEIRYAADVDHVAGVIKEVEVPAYVAPDETAPVVTGVEDGKEYQLSDTLTKVTPVSTDTDIKTVSLTKDNTKVDTYIALGDITEAGVYVLTVEDNAGNKTVVNFTIKAKL